jgi:hypothetical protein
MLTKKGKKSIDRSKSRSIFVPARRARRKRRKYKQDQRFASLAKKSARKTIAIATPSAAKKK